MKREVCEEAELLGQPTKDKVIIEPWSVGPKCVLESADWRIRGREVDVSTRIWGKEAPAIENEDASRSL
jgi:hypothetical protein